MSERCWLDPTAFRSPGRSAAKNPLTCSMAASGTPRRAHLRRGGEDRIDDRFVTGAAADIAGDRIDDRRAVGIGVAVEKRLGGDDHAAGAETALGGEAVGKSALYR